MIFVILLLALTIYALLTAPEGYEDEDGFHYGCPPKDDDEFFF